MRFERVRNSLELGLGQIQNTVPLLLAEKVCAVFLQIFVSMAVKFNIRKKFSVCFNAGSNL